MRHDLLILSQILSLSDLYKIVVKCPFLIKKKSWFQNSLYRLTIFVCRLTRKIAYHIEKIEISSQFILSRWSFGCVGILLTILLADITSTRDKAWKRNTPEKVSRSCCSFYWSKLRLQHERDPPPPSPRPPSPAGGPYTLAAGGQIKELVRRQHTFFTQRWSPLFSSLVLLESQDVIFEKRMRTESNCLRASKMGAEDCLTFHQNTCSLRGLFRLL